MIPVFGANSYKIGAVPAVIPPLGADGFNSIFSPKFRHLSIDIQIFEMKF